MNYEQVKLSAFADELIKITKHNFQKAAHDLSESERDHIKTKNFAVPEERKYPIEDENHARAAISMVGAHGSPTEKDQVYSAIIKKYPHLAARSESIKSAAAALAVKEPGLLTGLANHLVNNERAYELAGLGTLMAMPADQVQAHLRKDPGQSDDESFEQRSLLGGHMGHAALDTAGLGMMAVPLALAMHRGHQ